MDAISETQSRMYSLALDPNPILCGSRHSNNMLIMNMLVCMEHNLAMQGERTKRERPAFSRAMEDYTVKTVTTVDRTSFMHEMMEQIVKKLAAGKPRVLDLSSYKRIPIPKTFHGVPKPSLEELKKRNVCRFCAQ